LHGQPSISIRFTSIIRKLIMDKLPHATLFFDGSLSSWLLTPFPSKLLCGCTPSAHSLRLHRSFWVSDLSEVVNASRPLAAHNELCSYQHWHYFNDICPSRLHKALHKPSASQKGLITAIYYLGTWLSYVFLSHCHVTRARARGLARFAWARLPPWARLP
jgi:hypothetical protein